MVRLHTGQRQQGFVVNVKLFLVSLLSIFTGLKKSSTFNARIGYILYTYCIYLTRKVYQLQDFIDQQSLNLVCMRQTLPLIFTCIQKCVKSCFSQLLQIQVVKYWHFP